MFLKTHSKHREGGTKIVREEYSGDDFHRATGRWSVLHRLIDHAGDWYEETFHDKETGRLLHHTAEKLTEHRHRRRQ
jgi:hypothetical protein